MLKITAYADRLLEDLKLVDWPASTLEMQKNWIGRSVGAEVEFPLVGVNATIRVFTTRPDTLFGATYMVLAPEHPLVDVVTVQERRAEVEAYRAATARKSDLQRQDLEKEKTGVFTGGYAVNPVNGGRLPIWIADYVLMTYGTGAIMAVPAHDQRDWQFARTYSLPIREVIAGGQVEKEAFVAIDRGTVVNSTTPDGLFSIDGLEPAEQAVREEHPVGERHRRQDGAELRERLREVGEHEDLAAGDPEPLEAELGRLPGRAHHRRAGERPAVGDARRRLRQAVDAREVAVVGRVQPEPIADTTGCNGGFDLGAGIGGHGGGMSKAVQYWLSSVIAPASTVSSISWSSRRTV